ncbi:MAG: DUF2273 domain-containing protein [Acetobacteraceae bacterium]|nr:DUF2273 domain-containing protein [Acetobacteraceae bacterium]
MTEKTFREIWQHHRGKILGSLAGLVFSLLVVAVGFLWALFIGFCVGVGYLVGKRLDEEQEHVLDILSRILPPGRRHR